MPAINTNIKLPDRMADLMRAACPVPGNEIYKFMQVNMKAGDNIKAHKHKHHAVLYYPNQADAIIVTPAAGTMLYLPPGTLHEVPVVKRDRLSLALLVSP